MAFTLHAQWNNGGQVSFLVATCWFLHTLETGGEVENDARTELELVR